MRWLLAFAIPCVGLCLAAQPAAGQSCAVEPYCTAMRSCAEADYYFRECRHYKRDGDDDGIPCEELCGKTMEAYRERLSLSPKFPPD